MNATNRQECLAQQTPNCRRALQIAACARLPAAHIFSERSVELSALLNADNLTSPRQPAALFGLGVTLMNRRLGV